MIGDDDEIDLITPAAGGEAGEQPADCIIGFLHGRTGLRRFGAELVAGVVNDIKIERGQLGPLRRGQIQPGEQSVHPGPTRHFPIERFVQGGPDTVVRGFGARPEKTRAAHALSLGSNPHGLAPGPPFLLGLRHAEHLAEGWIPKPVADEAVVFRAQAGDERIMIRKGFGGKARVHPLRPHAAGRELPEHGCIVTVKVVPAKTVDGNQDEGNGRGGRRGAGRTGGEQQAGQPGTQDQKKRDRRIHNSPQGRKGCAGVKDYLGVPGVLGVKFSR